MRFVHSPLGYLEGAHSTLGVWQTEGTLAKMKGIGGKSYSSQYMQGGRKMILGGGAPWGEVSDTISGKGLELHMKINYDKSVSQVKC